MPQALRAAIPKQTPRPISPTLLPPTATQPQRGLSLLSCWFKLTVLSAISGTHLFTAPDRPLSPPRLLRNLSVPPWPCSPPWARPAHADPDSLLQDPVWLLLLPECSPSAGPSMTWPYPAAQPGSLCHLSQNALPLFSAYRNLCYPSRPNPGATPSQGLCSALFLEICCSSWQLGKHWASIHGP